MTEIYGRHGDLVICKEAVPTSVTLVAQRAPLVLAGREDGAHTIAQYERVGYAQDGEVQRLRVRESVTLSHGTRHNSVTLEPGDYVIYPLTEMNGALARRVED